MKNVQRAAEFYSRTAGRYARSRPHGIREPVLARQRDAIVELARPRSTDSVLDVGCGAGRVAAVLRSEEHTSELQSRLHLVCRLLLEKKNFKSPLVVRMRLLSNLTETA